MEPVARIDQGVWLDAQYRDSRNLASRQRLHQVASTAKTPWQRFVFQRLLVAGCRGPVLEVGCGPAQLWTENADRIPAGWRITLTDRSAGMVTAARAATSALDASIHVQGAEVTALPFADGSFHLVIANHMLYHVAQRQLGLAEIARVLAPGGALVAATNGPAHMAELHDLLQRVGLRAEAARASSGFDLVNGPGQLKPWFTAIRVIRHRNQLRVADPSLVVDYVRSLGGGELPAGAEAEIRGRVAGTVAERGCFSIRPESGLIVAKRRRRLPSRHRAASSALGDHQVHLAIRDHEHLGWGAAIEQFLDALRSQGPAPKLVL